MKILRIFQIFDLAGQSLLITGVSVPLLISVFDRGVLFVSLISLFFLGAWQLLSALSLGFARFDKFRHLYLLTAVTFCSLYFSASFLADQLSDWFNGMINFAGLSYFEISEYLFLASLIISFIAALYYFSYSYRDYRLYTNNDNL